MTATVKDAKLGEEKAKANCQTLKNSLKEKERDVADNAREQEEKIYSLRNEVCVSRASNDIILKFEKQIFKIKMA